MSAENPAQNQPSVEEVLLSDAYWEGPVYDPLEGLSRKEKTQYQDAEEDIYRDYEKAQEIGNVVLSLQGGGTMQTIPEGEVFPLPSDNPRQVVKVVTDSRAIIPRFGPKPDFYRTMQQQIKTLEELVPEEHAETYFNLLAEAMMKPAAYTLRSVSKIAKRQRNLVAVTRSVGYLRAPDAAGSKLGAVLDSSYFGYDEVNGQAIVHPLPQIAVGAIYKEAGRPRSLTKIAAAALIEANGVRWTHSSGGSARRSKPKRAHASWLPRLHPAS